LGFYKLKTYSYTTQMSDYAILEFEEKHIYHHRSQPLRIGTDCSGIEAPIQALRQLGPKHRYANCKELLSLQGMTNVSQVVTNSQFKKQIGNSMSINVVKELLFGIL
jgi:hypothetical protein